MGGYGSGRWGRHMKTTNVEQCRTLDISWLVQQGIVKGQSGSGSLSWKSGASVSYVVKPWENGLWILVLHYSITRNEHKESVELPVILQTTTPRFGGVRWWMTCPLTRQGKSCLKRIGKLYLPPGSHYFGCRTCHQLTYESCQESHKYDSLVAHIALQSGCSIKEVKQVLKTSAFF